MISIQVFSLNTKLMIHPNLLAPSQPKPRKRLNKQFIIRLRAVYSQINELISRIYAEQNRDTRRVSEILDFSAFSSIERDKTE
jgi:hypothetical protein